MGRKQGADEKVLSFKTRLNVEVEVVVVGGHPTSGGHLM